MLTFPNPAKLNLDSYLRLNIIVWLLDAQAELALRLWEQSGHVVGWPILKGTWLYSPEADGLGCPSQGAGSLLECGPATLEAPAACCSFPAVVVGGHSGALVWEPVISFGSLPPSVMTAGDVCSSGDRMVFSATLRNASAWNSSEGRKNIKTVGRNTSIESNSLWEFQLEYSMLLTQSLVKNKSVTREQPPSLVISGWCL